MTCVWWVLSPHRLCVFQTLLRVTTTLFNDIDRYGLKGKGLYMIFVAFLCLGLMDDSSQMVKMLGWATGIAFLATGVWHFFLVLSNPDFMDAYRPPTAGLERMSATGEMQQGENVV